MQTKLKVFYEPEIFFLQKYGGISRYFFELFCNFHDDNDIDFFLPLKFSDNHYLKNATFIKPRNLIRPVIIKGKNKFIKVTLRPIKKIQKRILNFQLDQNEIKLHELLEKQDFDIFHPTYYTAGVLQFVRDKPLVITVHDMIHELFPEQYADDPYLASKRELLSRADKIIAISNNTKQDLIKFHKIQDDKIEVIHHGPSFQRFNLEAVRDNSVPDEYILFVGERKGYKNFITFIKSVAPLLKNHKNLKIICVGSQTFNKDEKELFQKLNLSKRIHHFSASDDFLIKLYKMAMVFVFPSLYEGFGIPILEAFSAGCPVACSNASSFPEVAGDAAVFFDPHDEESMYNSIDALISDKDLREQMTTKGYERLKMYSWVKTAERTKKLYMSLL